MKIVIEDAKYEVMEAMANGCGSCGGCSGACGDSCSGNCN